MTPEQKRKLWLFGGIGAVVVIAGAVAIYHWRDAGVISDAFSADSRAERLAAIDELAYCTSGSAAEALDELSRDEDAEIAARALHAMARSEEQDRHRPRIVEAMDADRPAVREAAAAAMAYLGQDAAFEALKDLLVPGAEPDPGVRAAAAGTLGQLNRWESFLPLVEAMDDPSPKVRGRAYAGVKKMIGRDYRFRPNLPRSERLRIISALKADRQGLRQAFLAYQERKEGQEE